MGISGFDKTTRSCPVMAVSSRRFFSQELLSPLSLSVREREERESGSIYLMDQLSPSLSINGRANIKKKKKNEKRTVEG